MSALLPVNGTNPKTKQKENINSTYVQFSE